MDYYNKIPIIQHTMKKLNKHPGRTIQIAWVGLGCTILGICFLNFWHAFHTNTITTSSSTSSTTDNAAAEYEFMTMDGMTLSSSLSSSSSQHYNPSTKSRILESSLSSLSSSFITKRDEKCRRVYKYLTTFFLDTNQADQPQRQQFYQHGLTQDDLRRSRAWVGNEQRLAKFITKLQHSTKVPKSNDNDNNNNDNNDNDYGKPVNVIACGGSITMGHGIEPKLGRYSDRLQVWLNEKFPVANITTATSTSTTTTMSTPISSKLRRKASEQQQQQQQQHTVYNRGAHGADMCAMAKRMDLIFGKLGVEPDLVILEFAVNDYQGQDHKIHLDHKTDIFFDGFQEKATCAEAVVHNLIYKYPNTAIMFLEFQSAVLTRKTAQLLHMGVAQHYQIPVISYGEAVMPGFYQLLETLQPYDYSAPIVGTAATTTTGTNSLESSPTVFPYPHGCAACRKENIIEQFRNAGCQNLCMFARNAGLPLQNTGADCNHPPTGRKPCMVPFFSHDAVHPSFVGHGIATDLIIHALATVQENMCRGIVPPNHVLPPDSINFLGSNEELTLLTDFIFVKDTMDMFAQRDHLNSKNFSDGFQYYGDNMAERRGWICNDDKGGNYIEFLVNLPIDGCYILYLSSLRSYEGMGTFTVYVEDQTTNKIFQVDMDGIWEPHISVPSDVPLKPTTTMMMLNNDNTMNGQGEENVDFRCTGKCKVTVMTHPRHPERSGNKVKIMSLSARKCRPSDFAT